MKILFLTKYGFKGASSRYRTYQYLPYLQENGIECKFSPLFDDSYLENIYSKSWIGALKDVFKSVLRRIHILFSVTKYDLIFIEYEIFPYFPPFFEILLRYLRIKFVLDFDDAIFHKYDISNNWLIRFLLADKIPKIMRAANSVIAGSHYIKEFCIKSGAKDVIYIPTVIDIDRYPYSSKVSIKNRSDLISIVWIGSPSTVKYLQLLCEPLSKLATMSNIVLKIIGGSNNLDGRFNTEIVKWSFESEVDEIASSDIGVMPLFNGPWEEGKCALKLIQYMACGLPIIASPVGMNNILVDHGVNGFLASNAAEWTYYLHLLAADPELRKKMGASGRKKIEGYYSLEKQCIELLRVINVEKCS